MAPGEYVLPEKGQGKVYAVNHLNRVSTTV
jgi:hypothetical protein